VKKKSHAHWGSKRFLNGIKVFGPGSAIAEHIHNGDESVFVIKGSGVAHIDGVEYPVSAVDNTFIPAGIRHYFHSTSATVDMHILWTCASVDATRTVFATGLTTRIDEEHGTSVR
jgi:quercetin dioxygenase-like cupin family protein